MWWWREGVGFSEVSGVVVGLNVVVEEIVEFGLFFEFLVRVLVARYLRMWERGFGEEERVGLDYVGWAMFVVRWGVCVVGSLGREGG